MGGHGTLVLMAMAVLVGGGHSNRPGAIKVSFLSSSPLYTCSSLDDNAVVLLLLVEGPVVVTGSDGVATKLVSTGGGLGNGPPWRERRQNSCYRGSRRTYCY